MTFILIAR